MDVTETLITDGQASPDSAGQQGNTEATTATTQQGDVPQAGTTGDQPAQGETKQDEAAKPQGAPESYADFTLPEGVELDAAALDEIKAVAKELNLPQEQAQKLVDLRAKDQKAGAERFENARKEWADQTMADPEIGGDKWNESKAAASRALQAFGSKELTELLNSSGLGNHPVVVKTFVRIGKAVSEDGKVVTGGTATGPTDPAKTFYPGMK